MPQGAAGATSAPGRRRRYSRNGHSGAGRPKTLVALVTVIALVVGMQTILTTLGAVPQAQAAIAIGGIQARVSDQHGLNLSDATNCITYSPTSSPTSSAWVTSPNEARTGHGSSSGNCPSTLSTSTQSVVGVVPLSAASVTDGQPFALAKAIHYNNPISSNSDEKYTGKLSIQLTGFTAPNVISYDWSIWETPNSQSTCPSGQWGGDGNCRDLITFTSQIPTQTLTDSNGIKYSLVINGFDPVASGATCPASPSASAVNAFWTNEKATTYSCVYATLQQIRNVTVTKTVQGSAGNPPAKSFGFTTTGTLSGSPWANGSYTVNTTGSSTPVTVTTQQIARTDTAVVTEAAAGDDRWTLTSIACTQTAADGTVQPLPAASYNPAAGQLTLTNVPAPPNTAKPDINCNFTNTYRPTGTLTLVKSVPGKSLDPKSFTLTAKGAGTAAGTTISGVTGTTAVTAQRVPAGTYDLSETGPAGYVSLGWSCTGGTLTGTTVTVSDAAAGGAGVVCTATNRKAVGSLKIVKAIDDPAAGFTGTAATPFTGVYNCGAGDIPFSVSTGTPFTVNDLAAGVACTVTETAPTGNLKNSSYVWATPTYSGSLTITDNTTSTVTVTNHIVQNTGSLTISKVISGPGGYTGGPARTFPVTYTCTIGSATVASGSGVISTGTPLTVTGLPATASCGVTETLTAAAGDFVDASYVWTGSSTNGPATIGTGGGASIAVTNTYARQTSTLSVTKKIDGAGYIGTGTPFVVTYACGNVTGTLNLAGSGAAATATATVPANVSCTVSENTPSADLLDAGHAWGTPAYSPGATVTAAAAGGTTSITVTNPTKVLYGTITVVKKIAGNPAGVKAGTSVNVTVSCPGQADTALVVPVSGSATTGNIPVGTVCSVSEKSIAAGGLVDDSYAWGPIPDDQSVTVASGDTTVTVTNSVNRVYGTIGVTKNLVDPSGQVDPNRNYAFAYACVYGSDNPVTGTLTVKAGATASSPSFQILLGSACTVSESDSALAAPPVAGDPSYVWAGTPAPQTVTITKAASKPVVTMTNTVQRLTGTFGIAKTVAGDGATTGYNTAKPFGFSWSCTGPGAPVTGSTSVLPGAPFAGPSVPAGYSCTVTETDRPAANAQYAWGDTTFALTGTTETAHTANSVSFKIPVAANAAVSIGVTNTINRATGTVTVTKNVTGETAGLVAGTTFRVNLNCGTAGTFTFDLTDGASGSQDVPVGTTCVTTETAPTGGLLDASYGWGAPSISPASVIINAANPAPKVVVRNDIHRVTGTVNLTKMLGETLGQVGPDTVYTGSWKCTYPGAADRTGTWSVKADETITLADDVLLASACSATENTPGGPSTDPSYVWNTPDISDISSVGSRNTITVTNSVSRNTANIVVSKKVTGATAGYTGGTAKNFAVTVLCTVPGTTLSQTFNTSVADGGSETVSDVPAGWSCSASEAPPSGNLADGSYAWGTPAVTPAGSFTTTTDDAIVAVQNPIVRVKAPFSVTKIVKDTFGATQSGFGGGWSCVYGNDPAVTGTWSVGAAGGTTEVGSVLIGSVCSVTETNKGTLKDGSYGWKSPVITGPVTVVTGGSSVTVTNEVQRLYGTLTLTKQVVADQAGQPTGAKTGAVFVGTVTCAIDGVNSIDPFRFAIPAGSATVVSDQIPATSVCSVIEDTPTADQLVDASFAWTGTPAYNPGSVTVSDGKTANITITNTSTRVYGSISVTKSVTGAAAALVNSDRSFGGTVTCTYPGDAPRTLTWNTTPGNAFQVDGILVGSTCGGLAETSGVDEAPVAGDPSYVWLAPQYTAPVTVQKDVVASLTVTNPTERVLSSFTVTKLVTGAVDGITATDPAYTIGYTCTPGSGTAVSGSLVLAASGTGTVSDVPVGSSCVLTEPAAELPALKDTAWTWDAPAYAVTGATGTPSDRSVTFTVPTGVAGAAPAIAAVTVTNNVSRHYGTYTATKTSDPASGSTVKPGTVINYTVTVDSTGEVPVHDIVAVDDLSSVLPYATVVDGSIHAAQGSAAVVGDKLTWTVGDIAAHTSVTLTYQVRINDDAVGVTVHNSVTVGGETPGGCSPSPCTTDNHTPRWSVAKTSDPGSGATVQPGQKISYTLTVRNESAAAQAKDIVLSDDLTGVLDSADFGAFAAGYQGTAAFDAATGRITWTVGDVAPGKTVTLTYTVTVHADAFARTLRNVVTGNGFTPPQNCVPAQVVAAGVENGCVTEHHTPAPASITKSVVSAKAVGAGFEVRYRIVVTNPNVADALSYKLSDDLGFAKGTTISSAKVVSAPAGITADVAWDGRTNVVLTSGAELPAGDTHTYEVVVTGVAGPIVLAADRACSSSGVGHGLFNAATVSTLGTDRKAAACANIPDVVVVKPVPPTTVPPTTVPPVPVPPAPVPPSLPNTGAPVSDELTLALLLTLAGGALLLIGRRRRRES